MICANMTRICGDQRLTLGDFSNCSPCNNMFIETVSLTELGACQSVYLEHSWDSLVVSPPPQCYSAGISFDMRVCARMCAYWRSECRSSMFV